MWDQPEHVTSLCSEAQWVLGILGQRLVAANATVVMENKKKICFMLLNGAGNVVFAPFRFVPLIQEV